MKKKISLIILLVVTAIIFIVNELYFQNEKVEKIVVDTSNKIENIILSEETIVTAENTIKAVQKDEQLDTVKTITNIEETELETDAVVDQENISYNGDIKNDGLKLLGAYQGLTYYSQADTRWANKLYTSTNNKKQTMKSSACRANICCHGNNCF